MDGFRITETQAHLPRHGRGISRVDLDGASVASEIDSLGRARARAEHQARADAELEELKRRMGK